VWVKVIDPPADPRIPLLIGDCVHNIRQALDHLAYRLAVVVRGSDPPPNADKTAFPICSSRKFFDGGLPDRIGPRKAMPGGLYATLEGLQPYHGGDRQLLGVLHHLDNTDKHRFPPIVAAVTNVSGFRIAQAQVSFLQGPRVGPLEDDTPVIEYAPMPDTEVSMQLDYEPGIAFGKGSPVAAGQLVGPLLTSIRFYVLREVIEPLEAFL